MCVPAILGAMGIGGAVGGVTAGGAMAGATIGGALQAVGTLVGVVGSIAQGIGTANAARAQADAIERQRETERQLASTEDQRRRAAFGSQIRQQAAELAARGIRLDSPTAILLGQIAAREMSFDSQAVRSGAAARDAELSAEARAVRARGALSLLKGGFSAAGDVLAAAPTLWPGLSETRIGTMRGGGA